MEIWGGPECTVNRLGNRFRDQTRLTGHHDRIGDLAAFAALGITRLRYPVLWERVAPDRPEDRDWAWSDARLAEIARLGMRPIVGLLHHGSGPAYTSLAEDDFPRLFADYAAAAAERYPQVADWTPINEPLTTARFSALYGFWYPHARDEATFWRAMLNQIDATRLAMRAIRRVNPAARLIQTEDLAHYHATPELAATAAHFNARRWATWDLLIGRVRRDHPLWPHLARHGLADRASRIADDPCLPDVIGVNFYPTSERFLDHRLDAYPFPRPAEGFHELTAARIVDPPTLGLRALMREVWERYRLPLAMTEAHLGCTREEQMRWLWQAWRACRDLADDGVEVVAFTAWALLGNMDWNSLITVDTGHYESGAFDIRGPAPRPTGVARLLATLARAEHAAPHAHPVIAGHGWWQRDIRLEHARFVWAEPVAAPPPNAAPLVITGATGTLGRALARESDLRGLHHLLTDRATLPIDRPDRVAAFLDEHRPWAVVNAAGWVRVDDAEATPDACFAANTAGAVALAEACAARGIRYAFFSSDLVFDGAAGRDYVEADAPRALNVYGESKHRAEVSALAAHPGALAIRTAAFFSPHDPHNFAVAVERVLRAGDVFHASPDHIVSPTYVPDLVRASLDLLIDGEAGIWHLANRGAASWLDFGRMIAAALDLDPAQVVAADPDRLGWHARRPRHAALASTRGAVMPTLADAVARHAAIRNAHLAT